MMLPSLCPNFFVHIFHFGMFQNVCPLSKVKANNYFTFPNALYYIKITITTPNVTSTNILLKEGNIGKTNWDRGSSLFINAL